MVMAMLILQIYCLLLHLGAFAHNRIYIYIDLKKPSII
jgi:hypothetical protein